MQLRTAKKEFELARLNSKEVDPEIVRIFKKNLIIVTKI